MLTVDIKVNDEIVAQIQVQNLSNIAPVSDYAVSWTERAFPQIGLKETAGVSLIRQLPRNQGPLFLVAKILTQIVTTRMEKR